MPKKKKLIALDVAFLVFYLNTKGTRRLISVVAYKDLLQSVQNQECHMLITDEITESFLDQLIKKGYVKCSGNKLYFLTARGIEKGKQMEKFSKEKLKEKFGK